MQSPCTKGVSFLLALLLCGCSSFPADNPLIRSQVNASAEIVSSDGYERKWWEELNDSTINTLVEKALESNPTLEQALAQIDEAQAYVAISKSEYFPTIGATSSLTQNFDGNSATGKKSRNGSIGPSLSWEIDLFGRVRKSNEAAKSRLNARTADAKNTRNILASSVAGTLVDFRACRYASLVLEADEKSHLETFNLIHKKVQAGFSSLIEEALASRDLANTSTNLLMQDELCEKSANALVALTGLDKTAIQNLMDPLGEAGGFSLPEPPLLPAPIEATALLNHPGVRAAEHDAEAAWADIGVAKAERLPKLDLSALLSGQWIHAAGTTIDFATWSLGAGLSTVLFDGGRGAAQVEVSEARYQMALASLQGALRTAVQEAQDALAAQHSARKRYEAATTALMAGQASLAAQEALWRNGSTSLLELEDARRQVLTAQTNNISAKRDRVVAWITLHRLLGEPPNPQGISR